MGGHGGGEEGVNTLQVLTYRYKTNINGIAAYVSSLPRPMPFCATVNDDQMVCGAVLHT